MAIEKYGFFDSTSETVREYTEADWTRFSRLAARSGVRTANDLIITPGPTGLTVQAGYGLAMVDGHQYELYDDGGSTKTLSLNAPTSAARYDRIVIRLDNNADTVTMQVIQGSEGGNAPALTRTDAIYEISLAQVRVAVGASSISAEDITDEREDASVCGILQGLTSDEIELLISNANKKIDNAQATANNAKTAASTAQTAANKAQSTADTANAKATGAHYWAIGPLLVEAGTNGWTRDEENDRYYQDFAVEGMLQSLLPFVTCTRVGGAFPLGGCAGLSGAIRIYMTDVPEVADVLTVYALDVRADA